MNVFTHYKAEIRFAVILVALRLQPHLHLHRRPVAQRMGKNLILREISNYFYDEKEEILPFL